MTGFHDAYVAAPSRAAALRAWGASTDLFAMDAAEEVTDAKLMKEALAEPGVVIRQSRGSEAEHVAAAGPRAKAKAKSKAKDSPAHKPKPRPSRAGVAKAEKRVEEAEAVRAEEELAFEHDRAALREREEAARRAFDAKRRKLDAVRQEQVDAYDAALKSWRAT